MLAFSWAEPPRAPYPASGWRPAQPFPLPNEYGTPTNSPPQVGNTYLPPLAPVRRDFGNIQRSREEAAYKVVLNAPVENLQLLPVNSPAPQSPQIEELVQPVNNIREKGQYYVVNPDQSIQLVAYTTLQDKKQAQRNDFTALLKYTNVDDLSNDRPVYQYAPNGQIIRLN